jgi:hypothetical protein
MLRRLFADNLRDRQLEAASTRGYSYYRQSIGGQLRWSSAEGGGLCGMPSSSAGQKPGPYGFSIGTRRHNEPVGICRNHRSPGSGGRSGGVSISSDTPLAIWCRIHAWKQSHSRSEPKLPIFSHAQGRFMFASRKPPGHSTTPRTANCSAF